MDARRSFHHQTDCLYALAMSGDTRQVAALGPAAIAVHDDGDMFWELVRIKLGVKFSFLSVQPRRNGSQNRLATSSTLAQQLWPCNLPHRKLRVKPACIW